MAPPSPYSQQWAAAFLDAGGQVFNLLNETFGGKADGVTVEDNALLNALDLAPAGSTILLPSTIQVAGAWQRANYLFDSVLVSNALTATKKGIRILAMGALITKKTGTVTGGTGAANHLIRDPSGLLDDFGIIGGEWNLSRNSFSNGNTVSLLFSIRADKLRFGHMWIRDGIEEGFKLYKPTDVKAWDITFERIRNDGIQFHTPDEGAQYTGIKADRGADGLDTWSCRAIDIDDGLEGTSEGQAIAVSSSSATLQVKNARVRDWYCLRCVRGPWAEFNTAGLPGENIHFQNVTHENPRWHGIGMIAARQSSIVGARIRNPGVMAPGGGTSSEVAGIFLSGSSDPKGQENVVDDYQILETRSGGSAYMQYGIIVKNQTGSIITPNGRIKGATVKDLSVEWGTGKVENTVATRAVPPGFKVYRNSSKSIATATWTAIDHDTQVYDDEEYPAGTGGMWAVGDPTKGFFRTPGKYILSAGLRISANSTGERGIRVYLTDGTTDLLITEERRMAVTTASEETSMTVNVPVVITAAQVDATGAGYWMRIEVFQNSGVSLSTSTGQSGVWMGADYQRGIQAAG